MHGCVSLFRFGSFSRARNASECGKGLGAERLAGRFVTAFGEDLGTGLGGEDVAGGDDALLGDHLGATVFAAGVLGEECCQQEEGEGTEGGSGP